MKKLTLLILLTLTVSLSHSSSTQGASILLLRSPAPPQSVQPGEQVHFEWDVTAGSTEDYVRFFIENPDGQEIFEQEYLAPEGMSESLDYTVPAGSPDGVYWAGVEYYSLESGLEAIAMVSFYVATLRGDLQIIVFNDTNANGMIDPSENGIPNIIVRVDGPLGGQVTLSTEPDGTCLLTDVPVGTYNITVELPDWYINTTSTVVETEVTQDSLTTVEVGLRKLKSEIEASKTGPSTANPGEIINYMIRIENTGEVEIPSTTVVDPLPEQVEYLSSSYGGTYIIGGSTVAWNLTALPPGSSVTIELQVRVNPDLSSPTTIVNQALAQWEDPVEGQVVNSQTNEVTTEVNPSGGGGGGGGGGMQVPEFNFAIMAATALLLLLAVRKFR